MNLSVSKIVIPAVIATAMLSVSAFAQEAASSTPIYPAGIKPIAPYSPGMMHGDLLFVSGQIPHVDGGIPEYARDGVDDVQDQTKIVMDNIEKVLAEAGMTFANALQVSVFLTDLGGYGDFNAVYGPYWTDNGLVPPARAAVEVGQLPGGSADGAVLVEISLIAGK